MCISNYSSQKPSEQSLALRSRLVWQRRLCQPVWRVPSLASSTISRNPRCSSLWIVTNSNTPGCVIWACGHLSLWGWLQGSHGIFPGGQRYPHLPLWGLEASNIKQHNSTERKYMMSNEPQTSHFLLYLNRWSSLSGPRWMTYLLKFAIAQGCAMCSKDWLKAKVSERFFGRAAQPCKVFRKPYEQNGCGWKDVQLVCCWMKISIRFDCLLETNRPVFLKCI